MTMGRYSTKITSKQPLGMQPHLRKNLSAHAGGRPGWRNQSVSWSFCCPFPKVRVIPGEAWSQHCSCCATAKLTTLGAASLDPQKKCQAGHPGFTGAQGEQTKAGSPWCLAHTTPMPS